MAILRAHAGQRPSIGRDVFLADNATLVGAVEIGDEASVWYGAVLRGDVGRVLIGARTNIQDNATVHMTHQVSHALIGSDVIVGFPGETDDDFGILAAYLAESPLTHVHVFPYSDRPGTAAAALPGKVHGSIVRERAARVRAIGRDLNRRFHVSQHGAVRSALTIEDGSMAVTDNYLKVAIAPGRIRNEWVTLALTSGANGLAGVVV